MKKLLAVVLILLIAFSSLSFGVFADDQDPSESESKVTGITSSEDPAPQTGASVKREKQEIASSSAVATPQIKKFEAVKSGVRITWDKVAGAVRYRLFIKNGSSWKSIGDTASTTFDDTAAKIGTEYTYTIRCLDKNNKFSSAYNAAGWKFRRLSAPTLTKLDMVYATTADSAHSTGEHLRITWNKVSGAKAYRVYAKAKGQTAWTKIGETAAASFYYHPATASKEFTLTVRCQDEIGSNILTSWIDEKGKSAFFAYSPSPTITNTSSGQKLSWDKIDGVSKYRVYLKNGSSWKILTTTSAASYTNTNVVSGTNYTYTLRSVDSDNNLISTYNPTGTSETFLGMPKLKKLESKSYGIHLEWEKIPGAERYRVYAHNGTGWVRLKDYEDTNAYFYAEDGLEYLYTVRCVDELGNLKSDFDHAGFDIIYHAAPEITGINNTSSGVRITWGARKGITKYRVFFDAGAGWKRITDTNKTEITYTGAQTGSVYYFTVRSLDSSGKFISDYLENNNFPLTYRAPSVTMIDENKIISQLSSYGQKLGLKLDNTITKTDNNSMFFFDTSVFGADCSDITADIIKEGKVWLDAYKRNIDQYDPNHSVVRYFRIFTESSGNTAGTGSNKIALKNFYILVKP